MSEKRYKSARRVIPYLVIVDESGKFQATYNRDYEKIEDFATPRLLSWCKEKGTQTGTGFELSRPEQKPSWLAKVDPAGCVRYWTHNDGTPFSERLKIPIE